MLCRAHRVRARCIDHCDPVARRRIHIDVVDTYPGPTHYAKKRCSTQQSLRHPRARTNQQRMSAW